MESETFKTRILSLLQKSRKAVRLYSSASSEKPEGIQKELSLGQVSEWREINTLLLKKLSQAAETPNSKRLVFDVFGVRNEFATL